MRSPAARPGVGPFGGDALAASFQTRKTTCLPSGDQLGNPELPGPVVTVRTSEPSAFTIITCAGWVARGTKYAPAPNTIQRPSGDHWGDINDPSARKRRRGFVPSAFQTTSAVRSS